MKVAVPLAKNILALLGITAAASAIDAGIQKKTTCSGTTTLLISDKKMNNIIEIVQALACSNILSKGVTKTIKNKIKEQKEAFLGMFLGNLGTSLLGNMLAGKGTLRAGSGKGIVTATFGNKKGKGIVRAGYGNELNFECLVL